MFAVQGFDGGVDVQYPGGVKRGLCTAQQMAAQPALATSVAQACDGPAQCVFADDFVHAQYLCADTISSQSGDVGVAVVSGQYGQQPGAQDICVAWRVGAGIGQWAAVDPGLVDAGGSQKFGKEGQLGVGCGAGLVIPLHVDATTGGVNLEGSQCVVLHRQLAPSGFTHLMNTPNLLKLASSLALRRFCGGQLPEIG